MNLRRSLIFVTFFTLFIFTIAFFSPLTTKVTQAQPYEAQWINQIGGRAVAFTVQGDYAYLGVGPRMVIVDISGPAPPIMVGQTEVLPDIVVDVALSGNFAYLAVGRAGLRIFDVSNPSQPVETGYLPTEAEIIAVSIAGEFAYITDGRLID